MRDAWRHFRAAMGEFYYELPRMVATSLIWFVPSLATIWVLFRTWIFLSGDEGLEDGMAVSTVAFTLQATGFGLLSLLFTGPATAGLYEVIAPLARGDLFEIGRFWRGVRTKWVRAWLLLTLDLVIGVVLALNIWFYWNSALPGIWLVAIIFAYALVVWAAIQPYLFPLLVELDQGVLLIVRNALFMAVDNFGLTIGLLVITGTFLAIAAPLGAVLVPFALPAIVANIHNRAVVTLIDRYRAEGRILPRAGELPPENLPGRDPAIRPERPTRDEDDARGLGGRPRRLRDQKPQ